MENFIAKISKKKYINEDTLQVVLDVPEDFSFIPGQFINVTVNDLYKRPYSIIEQNGNKITIVVGVRNPGKGSDFFTNVKAGDETEVMGPLGKFFCEYNEREKVFISAGTGIAPFIPMIKKIVNEHGQKITIFHGVKKSDDDFGIHYLNNEVEKGIVEYVRCISQGIEEDSKVEIFHGRVTNKLKASEFNWENTDFYLCGRNEMIVELKEILMSKDVSRMFIENYG